MKWLRRWFSVDAPIDWPLGQTDWEQAGQKYRDRVEAAHRAAIEDAAETGLIHGLQLAQQYVLAQRRAYPEGRSPATDVSRETCNEIHRILVSLETEAKRKHRWGSMERASQVAETLL